MKAQDFRTSCYLLKYKPRAILVGLQQIFIYLILFYFLLEKRGNECICPVSGKIGNATFTIFACIFTVFSVNYKRALTASCEGPLEEGQ